MANTDSPRGGELYKNASGYSSEYGLTPYYIPSSYGTALFIGDPVVITGESNTARVSTVGGTFQPGSLPAINKSSAGGVLTGFVVGFCPTNDDSPIYNPASTERVALVADSPDYIFVMQGDSATASAAGNVGANADMVFTESGSTATGLSGVELDVSTIGTGADLQLKIVGFLDDSQNEIGVTHSKYLVKINESTLGDNTAGI